MKQSLSFVRWCREHYRCKTLEQCREHAEEWIKKDTQSARTMKTRRASLAKLYGEKGADLCKDLPRCTKSSVVRSRGDRVRDQHFSEHRNRDAVALMRSTGARRAELMALTGKDLYTDENGDLWVHIGKAAKGGREREVLVIGDVETVKRLFDEAGEGRVVKTSLSNCDIHHFRAEYAAALYGRLARSYEEVKNDHSFYNPLHYNGKGKKRGGFESCLYITRGEPRPRWFDKRALLTVSTMLGHNRISVAAISYLYAVQSYTGN